LEENGVPTSAGDGEEGGGSGGHPREQREGGRRERKKRERRKKGRAPVQVGASHANRTAATKSRCMLWHDWWTCGARRLGRKLPPSRQRDSVASDDPA
jgi:hypothetical protein